MSARTDYDRVDRPATAQPPPGEGSGLPVHALATERARRFGCPRMAAVVEERGEFGYRKYGTRLRAFNGRDAMCDAVEEIADFVAYLAQADAEGRPVGHLLESAIVMGEELARRAGVGDVVAARLDRAPLTDRTQ